MQTSLIYLISLACALGALVIRKIFQLVDAPTRRVLFSFLRKKFLYTLVIRRQKSSSDVNIFALLRILLIVAANITACTIKITTPAELAKRCGSLFIINVVPLYLGGRTSLLADRLIRLSLSEYSLIHRWMGRICVIQGLIHGVINASTASLSLVETLLLSFLAAIGCLSILYVRRYMYEIFLKTHLIFSLALAGTLWFHIRLAKSRAIICLGVASALWLMQQITWLIRLIYRNFGSGLTDKVALTSFTSSETSLQVMNATITLERPWAVAPGQYIYLTLPTEARHSAGFIQSHPYVIAWAEGEEKGGKTIIHVLIQRQNGFSDTIYQTRDSHDLSAIVDGPYGHTPPLDGYDKVMFAASGIGIAAHLLSIKHLLKAHEDRSARIRRLTLVWFLETRDQEQWASVYLNLLMEMDTRGIFLLYIYIPGKGSQQPDRGQMADRLIKTTAPLCLRSRIESEASAEAGNMAIIVCGTPNFEELVRRGIRDCHEDIHCFTAGFHPEETRLGRLSRERYEVLSKADATFLA